jgi:hypothetical protein
MLKRPYLVARNVQSKTHACSRSCVCSEEAVERKVPGEEGGVSGSPVGIPPSADEDLLGSLSPRTPASPHEGSRRGSKRIYGYDTPGTHWHTLAHNNSRLPDNRNGLSPCTPTCYNSITSPNSPLSRATTVASRSTATSYKPKRTDLCTFSWVPGMFRQGESCTRIRFDTSTFAGTSYTNPASLLIFEAITRDSSNGVVVTWQGVKGKQYGLYRSSSLDVTSRSLFSSTKRIGVCYGRPGRQGRPGSSIEDFGLATCDLRWSRVQRSVPCRDD